MKRLACAWNEFFFSPTSPASIGVFRIAYGIVVFLSLLGKFPCRGIFYGDDGIVSRAAMVPVSSGPSWLYLHWVPGTEPWLGIYFGVLLLAALSLALGFRTRLSAAIIYLGLVSLTDRNSSVDNGGDILLRCDALLLIFSSAGAAYSIDRWLAVRAGRASPQLEPCSAWAQRLIQLQVCYFISDTSFLKIGGASWRDGTAMYYALRYLELRRFDLKYLFYHLWQIKLATYATLVAEFSAGSLIWVRKLRYWVILIAFGLHEGINLAMQFPVFQYIMMATLLTFVYPEDMERAIGWISPRVQGPPARSNRQALPIAGRFEERTSLERGPGVAAALLRRHPRTSPPGRTTRRSRPAT